MQDSRYEMDVLKKSCCLTIPNHATRITHQES
jgi:hypothetical protein